MSSVKSTSQVPVQAISIPSSVPNLQKATPVMEDPPTTTASTRPRRGGKKMMLQHSQGSENRIIINTNNIFNHQQESYLGDMKKRSRSKSPLRRLLRTLSRSPLRRRGGKKNETSNPSSSNRNNHSTSSSNPSQTEKETDLEYLVTDHPSNTNQQQQHIGDGVSSLGTADFMHTMEYMVDPLGGRRYRSRPSTDGEHQYENNGEDDEDSSALDSWRESRETDSLPSKDSRGSSRYERPRPVVISSTKRRVKLAERPPTPKRLHGLPAVREDGSSAAGTNEMQKSESQDSSTSYRKERPRQKTARKVAKSQVVWTKYGSPTKASPVPKVQSASTSSLCSEASLSTRVLLLLLHPTSKFFELIQLIFTPETSTLGDLLDYIPSQATEAKLAQQQYVGLARASKHSEAWTERLQPASHAYVKNHSIPPAGIIPGDVLVAIPYGYTRRQVVRLGLQILESPRIKSLLVDKFRAEMNVPKTITTANPASPHQIAEREPTATARNSQATFASLDSRSDFKKLTKAESESSMGSKGSRRSVIRRQKTPPPAEFWDRSKLDDEEDSPIPTQGANESNERDAVEPVSSRSLMAADSMDKEDSSSWEDVSSSESDPNAVVRQEVIPGEKQAMATPPLESSEAALHHEVDTSREAALHHDVQPVSSRSLMTSVAVPREDSSSSEDVSYSESDMNVSEQEIILPEISTAVNAQGTALKEDFPSDESHGPSVGPEGADSKTKEGEAVNGDIKAEPEVQQRDPPYRDNSVSPVRQRIQELEERIEKCPGVPAPRVGPHDFSSHSEYGSVCSSEDLPELVETAHADERYDSEDSGEQEEDCKPSSTFPIGSDEDPNNAGATFPQSVESEEHREILREALARAESLPESHSCTSGVLERELKTSDELDDDVTVVTNNTANSRAPIALAGHYEEGSVETNYSLWSHSVDSSLVSRYSLMSHSHRSMMTEEEIQLVEVRTKSRQRRRQKAKMARSLKKAAFSLFVLMVALYWMDPRRNVSQMSDSRKPTDVNTPLGLLGILQFFIAMCVLLKVQLLWKHSAEMKSGSCPFLEAVNVFVEGLKEKSS